MVEQVLSIVRHDLTRFHRPAELKLERRKLTHPFAHPLFGCAFFMWDISKQEVNGMDAGSRRPDNRPPIDQDSQDACPG